MSQKQTAKLPSLSHFSLNDFEQVYEPAEDTYLMCDTILKELHEIIAIRPLLCLEIGSGSGCVITYLGQMFRSKGYNNCLFIATDLNPAAAIATKYTAQSNFIFVDVILTNFTSGMDDFIHKSVDVILFNPPYVPTPDEEVGSHGISAAWAGGTDGRLVIDRFLTLLPNLLSATGICYLLLVQENRPKDVIRKLSGFGLRGEVVLRQQARNEHQMVLRIERI